MQISRQIRSSLCRVVLRLRECWAKQHKGWGRGRVWVCSPVALLVLAQRLDSAVLLLQLELQSIDGTHRNARDKF